MTFPELHINDSDDEDDLPQSLKKVPKLAVSTVSACNPSLYFSTIFDRFDVDSLIDLNSSNFVSSSLSLKNMFDLGLIGLFWDYFFENFIVHLATMFSSSFPLNFRCNFLAFLISQYWWFIVNQNRVEFKSFGNFLP